MTPADEKRIPLRAISARQRRLVERHLPLVYLTLRRCSELSGRSHPARERRELVQEGCLALVEAVRAHDPSRYGDFATYAMARIRYAFSRYVHEDEPMIRIPFITQRRHRKRRERASPDHRHPDPLPRVVRMDDDRDFPSRRAARHRHPEGLAPRPGAVSVGDLMRDCLDRALARVVTEMTRSPRCKKDTARLVHRCSQERWSIPEPLAKTPIRRLAKSLKCSTGRITHWDERFRSRIAALLESDDTFLELRRLARRHGAGWRHRLSARELARFQARGTNRRDADRGDGNGG